MPILTVGDKTLTQSGAIQRYLAREFGQLGSNAWEAAQIDSIVEALNE